MYQAERALKDLYRSDSIEKNFIAEFWKPGDNRPFLTIYDGARFYDMSLEESLTSDENLNFGSCEASQIKLTVIDLEENVKGCEMTLYQTLDGVYPSKDLWPGTDTFPGGYIMPFGRYVVQSADRQAKKKYRDIMALDFMCKFDRDVIDWYNALPFPLSLRDFRARLCRHVGVTEAVLDYLPNDGMLVEKTIEASELIGRNVLIACEQANGAFGHFDRNGILQHVILEPNGGLFPSRDLYPAGDVYPALPGTVTEQSYDEKIGSYLLISNQMEEYTVQSIEKIQIRQEEGDIGAIYGTGENCLTVEGNFLLYGKTAEELERIAVGIYGMVSNRMYVPYQCNLKGLPYVEVGDSCLFDFDDGSLSTYVIKRSLKGIFALKDTYSATGEEIRRVENNINTEVIQLKGKAAILKRNVDEVSANLVDFEKQTEALFQVTAEQITAEVKRAQEAEAALTVQADQITASVKNLKTETEAEFRVTADQITAEVKRAKTAESSIITQTSKKIELKVSKGDVSSQLNSELEITGNSIDLTTGHFTITAKNFSVDAAGNADFAGAITGGSTIDVGALYADNDELVLGDFIISANDQTTLASTGAQYILLSTDTYSNGIRYGSLTLGDREGKYGTEIIGGVLTNKRIFTELIDASTGGQISKFYNIKLTRTSEWKDYTLGAALDFIWGDKEYGLDFCGGEVRALWEQVEYLWEEIENIQNSL